MGMAWRRLSVLLALGFEMGLIHFGGGGGIFMVVVVVVVETIYAAAAS